MNPTVKRFLSYTQYDTQSQEGASSTPSTDKQFDLARHLVGELEGLGLEEVTLDDRCYLYATLPATEGVEGPVLGLIAHMDTSPDMDGGPVKWRIEENYHGGDIVLDKEGEIVLSPGDFPELLDYKGQDIIVTDGHTLLGADDKAGIAAIVSALEYYLSHPELPHGKIRVAFTPDEEIGQGADGFDVDFFGADFAFTVDGGALGELEYENFNAASAQVTIQGRNIHPGSAKDKMVNALVVGMELHQKLPALDRPEHTEGYEGFFLLTDMAGGVDQAKMSYIIRDHDADMFAHRKATLEKAVEELDKLYPGAVDLEMTDSYYNMKEKITPHMEIIDLATTAMEKAGVTPNITPIRGGTDGSRLSYMGLPCPNIFTGGMNYHGRYEYLPIPSLLAAKETVIHLIGLAHGLEWEK